MKSIVDYGVGLWGMMFRLVTLRLENDKLILENVCRSYNRCVLCVPKFMLIKFHFPIKENNKVDEKIYIFNSK